MDLLVVLLPAIIALLSLGYIFVTYKERIGIIVIAVLSLVNIGLVVTAIIFSGKLNDQIVFEQEKYAALEQWRATHIVRLEAMLTQFNPSDVADEEVIAKLVDYGWTPGNPVFSNSLAAAQARIELIADKKPSTKKIEILGVPDFTDLEKMKLFFEELGYYMVLPEPEIITEDIADAEDQLGDEEGEVEAETPKLAQKVVKAKAGTIPNVLYYGHKIADDDIKLVTLTLMQAGVGVRMVRPFRAKTKANSYQIELGWKKSYARRTPYSVEKLMGIDQFSRK